MVKYNSTIVQSVNVDEYKRHLAKYVNLLIKQGVKPRNITRGYAPYESKLGIVYSCQVDWWTVED